LLFKQIFGWFKRKTWIQKIPHLENVTKLLVLNISFFYAHDANRYKFLNKYSEGMAKQIFFSGNTHFESFPFISKHQKFTNSFVSFAKKKYLKKSSEWIFRKVKCFIIRFDDDFLVILTLIYLMQILHWISIINHLTIFSLHFE